MLRVDYHPDSLLYTATQKARINDDRGFPWKTNMCITQDEVSVSAGFGSPWETLWKKE